MRRNRYRSFSTGKLSDFMPRRITVVVGECDDRSEVAVVAPVGPARKVRVQRSKLCCILRCMASNISSLYRRGRKWSNRMNAATTNLCQVLPTSRCCTGCAVRTLKQIVSRQFDSALRRRCPCRLMPTPKEPRWLPAGIWSRSDY